MTTITVRDWNTGREVCPECHGTGWVDPWAEDADYPCPLCHADGFDSADDYFAVSDKLSADGLSAERVARAEHSHLQERTYTDRTMQLERSERERAAGW